MDVLPGHLFPLVDLAGTPVLVSIRKMRNQLIDTGDVAAVTGLGGCGIWRVTAVGRIRFLGIFGSRVLVEPIRHRFASLPGQTVEPLTHDLKFRLSAKPLLCSLRLWG